VAENNFSELNNILISDETGAVSSTRKTVPNHKRPIQKSSTLQRKAVKKPVLNSSSSLINSKSMAMSPIAKNTAVNHNLRSKSTTKSPLIQKFANQSHTSAIKSNDIISPIQKKPVHQNSAHNPEIEKKYNPFDDAVERAVPTVHHVTKKSSKNKSITSNTTLFGIVFIIVGFIALYVAIPNITARYVAYKSGVNIVLPYKIPAGYTLETTIPYSTDTARLIYVNGNNTFDLIEQIDSTIKSQPLSDITKLTGGSNTTYGWTKNNLDFFLVTNNNLTLYDVNNIYSST
jgi:hypothetical protein